MLDLPDTPATSCRCTRCGGDHSSLVFAARYCPHCGVRLSDARVRLADPTPIDRVTSLVVCGYSKAMFRLGTHYEFRHNDDEALRCYGKASRLGHDAAKVKLIDIPLAKKFEAVSGGT